MHLYGLFRVKWCHSSPVIEHPISFLSLRPSFSGPDRTVFVRRCAQRRSVEIDSFVPRSEIDQRFFDTPYYVRPSEQVGQETFAVIREAMRGKGMVALGRLVLAKRERVIALEPYEKGLLGTTLRYPYEVRKAEDYFCDLPDLAIAPDMLKLAELILDSKAAEFDPATFRDRYEEALLAHLKAKQAGIVQERRQTFTPPHRVVNLMEALRRSVAEDARGALPRKGAAAAGARKRA
jgi:DNA end-binding protein Ku